MRRPVRHSVAATAFATARPSRPRMVSGSRQEASAISATILTSMSVNSAGGERIQQHLAMTGDSLRSR